MLFHQLFDPSTSTFTYLLADAETREAVLIDPVQTELERYLTLIANLKLKLLFIFDTHVHADHVTAAGELRVATGAKTVLSANAGVKCADISALTGASFSFGKHSLVARETPGHTNGCITYVSANRAMAFTGDALLINGCGRTDFQEGDAHTLYNSIHQKIFSLPSETRIYPGHDYNGQTVSTVGTEKESNSRLGAGRSLESFVELMEKLNLPYPRHIDKALPANQACGRLQHPDTADGHPSDVRQISAETLYQLSGEFSVIDIRRWEELGETGTIPNARWIPQQSFWSEDNPLSGVDCSRPVVILCNSGRRSRDLIQGWSSKGKTPNLLNVTGGIQAWLQLGFDTVSPIKVAK